MAGFLIACAGLMPSRGMQRLEQINRSRKVPDSDTGDSVIIPGDSLTFGLIQITFNFPYKLCIEYAQITKLSRKITGYRFIVISKGLMRFLHKIYVDFFGSRELTFSNFWLLHDSVKSKSLAS